MTLHFAYGSNMSRALMRGRCPAARALGAASLEGWRFVITRDGYASLVRDCGALVHGVLWRLTPRDLAALHAYEQSAYLRRVLPVRQGAARRPALVYLAPERGGGRPRPGYQELVVAAARDWGLPADYVETLVRWVPGFRGTLGVATGEMG
ncbi:MAG TPA: gamma-glutamylcyclotransferase family protein [Xanthobacteraceae bacterium]|nr:gamma-glutamylcyclotransferase family protein [Xanthobacteraceae bacterium]